MKRKLQKKTEHDRKELDYYLLLPYTIVIKPNSGGSYFAKIEELPGCMTEGESLEDVVRMIEDAKLVWIEGALEDGIPIPEPEEALKKRRRVA